jgi:hypothetical protein
VESLEKMLLVMRRSFGWRNGVDELIEAAVAFIFFENIFDVDRTVGRLRLLPLGLNTSKFNRGIYRLIGSGDLMSSV